MGSEANIVQRQLTGCIEVSTTITASSLVQRAKLGSNLPHFSYNPEVTTVLTSGLKSTVQHNNAVLKGLLVEYRHHSPAPA